MTVCLAMIVKDESAVIRDCLASVLPVIDAWCIVDTGSTDDTRNIIREYLRDIPGVLHDQPWMDFAFNRTEALILARDKADYTLIIDADDTLVIPLGFVMPDLTADSYTFDIDFAPLRYRRAQMVRNTLPWRYRGVLHEYLECTEAKTQEHLPLTIKVGQGGARRQDPDKYRKDAAALERALETETDPFLLSRYTFYLAQSYRDCGENERALSFYAARVAMGFWASEVYVSLLNMARLRQAMGHDPASVLLAYEAATRADPDRAEAWHGAAHYCRSLNRYTDGFRFAQRGVMIPQPLDALFIEPWIYEYGILDELAVNAYWCGHHRYAVDACDILLSEEKTPDHYRSRLIANANFSRRQLLAH